MARRKVVKKNTVAPKAKKPAKKSEPKEEFVVEAICGIRSGPKKNEVEYLIKWEGYPFEENSWEYAEGLNADQLKTAFKKVEDFLLTPGKVVRSKKRAGKEDGEYQVETFRGIYLDTDKNNQILYGVKWFTYPETSNTWESFSNLENSPEFLKIFADAHEALVNIQEKFASILPDVVVSDQEEDVEPPKLAKKSAPAKKSEAQKKGKAKKNSADDEEEDRSEEEPDDSADEDVSPPKRGKKSASNENEEDATGSQKSKVSRASRATSSKSPAPNKGATKKARGRPKGKGKKVSAERESEEKEEDVKSPAKRTRGSSSRGRSESEEEKENASRTSPAKKAAKGKGAKRDHSLSPAKNGNRKDSLMSDDESVAVPSNEDESDEAPKKTPAKSKAGRPAKESSSGRRPGPKSKVGTSASSDEDDVNEDALGSAKKKLQIDTDDDEDLEDVAAKTAGRRALAFH